MRKTNYKENNDIISRTRKNFIKFLPGVQEEWQIKAGQNEQHDYNIPTELHLNQYKIGQKFCVKDLNCCCFCKSNNLWNNTKKWQDVE